MESRNLTELSDKLKKCDPAKIKALAGWDGYVDTAVHPVDKRLGPDSYERILTLTDYGNKFLAAAGLSMNLEMVPLYSKIGGIGAIFANSLSKHGFDVTYIGAMGKESIHPVYKEMQERATLYSISDPGLSDAIEFLDGKVISSKLEPFKDVNWDNLMKIMTPAQLAEIFDNSDFIGYGGWTLTINVMSIWNGVLNEVFPLMKNTRKREMFFDLSDPAKRTAEDIMEALEAVKRHKEKFVVGMGFNLKESYEIAELYGKKPEDFNDITEIAQFLKEQIDIEYVIVHPVKEACGFDDKTGRVKVQGPYCAEPKLTTGAGDNFNAGFIVARMMGLSMEECLTVGTANSGFYVRNARSASFPELCKFIRDWGEGNID